MYRLQKLKFVALSLFSFWIGIKYSSLDFKHQSVNRLYRVDVFEESWTLLKLFFQILIIYRSKISSFLVIEKNLKYFTNLS